MHSPAEALSIRLVFTVVEHVERSPRLGSNRVEPELRVLFEGLACVPGSNSEQVLRGIVPDEPVLVVQQQEQFRPGFWASRP